MGNCMQANNIVTPQTAQKRSTNVSRVSKKSADAIPTYPSIEDVIRNNKNRKNKDFKENLVLWSEEILDNYIQFFYFEEIK